MNHTGLRGVAACAHSRGRKFPFPPNSIKGEEEEKAVQTVFDFSGFNNNFKDDTTDDFELVSFLVVG